MYVTKTDVATPGGRTAGAIDAKDYGSKGVHMITNCGVGASNPHAIYIRPFCIDTAVFKGDEALSDGEMPIRKALSPVEFANDLKEQLEKIAPARILKDTESPRTGWLVEGHFQMIDGGDPYAGLIQGTDGNFYGTTENGGGVGCEAFEGCGTVYQITPGGFVETFAASAISLVRR